MSETRDVRVEFRDLDLLAEVVKAMGGKVLGEGTHDLYATAEQGWGFTLPSWTFPLVLRADGNLRYDDYHGKWGDILDLDRIGSEYAMRKAERTAQGLGYYCERVSTALKVLHPGGQEIWVFPDGRVEAVGFNGVGCDEACATFANALGGTVETRHKAEFYNAQQNIILNE